MSEWTFSNKKSAMPKSWGTRNISQLARSLVASHGLQGEVIFNSVAARLVLHIVAQPLQSSSVRLGAIYLEKRIKLLQSGTVSLRHFCRTASATKGRCIKALAGPASSMSVLTWSEPRSRAFEKTLRTVLWHHFVTFCPCHCSTSSRLFAPDMFLFQNLLNLEILAWDWNRRHRGSMSIYIHWNFKGSIPWIKIENEHPSRKPFSQCWLSTLHILY